MPDMHAAEIDQKINVEGWFVKTMPDLNQANQFVFNYLTQWSIWWLEYANIDAIRFDTYQYNKKKPLAKWANRLYKEYPNMYYCGETWINEVAPQVYWQKNILKEDIEAGRYPGMIDFPMNNAVLQTFQNEKSIHEMYVLLTQDFLYLDPHRNLTFLSNHDTDRFFSLIEEDIQRMKMAMTFLLTSRGIPQLYYGEEILMTGLKKNGGDAQVRFDFPGGWKGDKVNAFQQKGLTTKQSDFYTFTKNMLQWRKKNAELLRGKLVHFKPENEQYVYFRIANKKAFMVVINNSDKDQTLALNRFQEILKNFRSGKILNGQSIKLDYTMPTKAKTAIIIELQ